MPTLHRFEDLEAWQVSRKVVKRIYEITASEAFARDLDLVRQLRRAAVSMTANIAEGFGRGIRNEFIHFLTISLGSAREVQNHLYIALDQNYIGEKLFLGLYEEVDHASNLIGGLVRYLRKSNIKGIRYK